MSGRNERHVRRSLRSWPGAEAPRAAHVARFSGCGAAGRRPAVADIPGPRLGARAHRAWQHCIYAARVRQLSHLAQPADARTVGHAVRLARGAAGSASDALGRTCSGQPLGARRRDPSTRHAALALRRPEARARVVELDPGNPDHRRRDVRRGRRAVRSHDAGEGRRRTMGVRGLGGVARPDLPGEPERSTPARRANAGVDRIRLMAVSSRRVVVRSSPHRHFHVASPSAAWRDGEEP